MAGQILSALQREQLEQFPKEINSEDLNTFFRFSPADREQIDDLRGATYQLRFSLQLAAMRYLGFCPTNVFAAPVAARLFVASQLRIELAEVDEQAAREQTRTEHLAKARDYLGWRTFKEAESSQLFEWLVERALEHERPITLLELALTKLKTDKITRPGLTVLERLVLSAREQAHKRTYQAVEDVLVPERLEWLDKLLARDSDIKLTRLEWLRQQPTTNSPASILTTLEKLTYLTQAGVAKWSIAKLNPNRRKYLAELARRSSVQALASISVTRRYPILLAFVVEAIVELTDLAVEMFDAYLAGVYSRAGRELNEFRLKIAPTANQTLHWFSTLSQVVLDEKIADPDLRQAIYAQLPAEELKKALEECQKLTRPLDDNYFDFLAERYSKIREFAPKLLQTLNLQANLATKPLLDAIEVLRGLNRDNKRQVPGSAPASFVNGKWQPYVYNDNGTFNRKYYELCVLWELRQALRGGNIWVEGGRRYAPLATHLLDTAQWQAKKAEIHQLLDLPVNGAARFKQLELDITDGLLRLEKLVAVPATTANSEAKNVACAEPDPTTPASPVRLEGNKLRLSRFEALEIADSTKKLRKLVWQRLPQVELVDLIIEVDQWLKFSHKLTHAQDGIAPSPAQLGQLYAAIVAQACNLGLANMERMSGFSYGELSWITNWHLRDETLKEAITVLVNYQHAQPLTRHWGDGSFSSSDGQRFVVAVASRSSAALPRYFGYGKGLTMLSWVADQFAVYGTKTVKPTDREALYTLDAILDNKSELPIHFHTTDTAGYTEIIFALFDLLGLEFEPRLRDISDQRLWRPENVTVPTLFAPLFKGSTVKAERIVSNWDEMARLVGSLKVGQSSASLLISKLQAFPRQNALAATLQEYGRLVKTRFILRYLESEQLRRRIGKQLDKGETVNALRDHLCYGNKGQIRKHGSSEQLDQGLCISLVMNCIIIWNTVYMSRVLAGLRREGIAFSEEDLSHLSPCRYRHINVYGKYSFDLEVVKQFDGYRPLRMTNSAASPDEEDN
jgi:TnpA family transposase